jgi:hypothetical protein
MCELWAIAEIIYPLVSAKDCALLKAILADHSCARKPSTRARTILGLADRLGAAEVGRCAGAGGLVLQGRRSRSRGTPARYQSKVPQCVRDRRDRASGCSPELCRAAR